MTPVVNRKDYLLFIETSSNQKNRKYILRIFISHMKVSLFISSFLERFLFMDIYSSYIVLINYLKPSHFFVNEIRCFIFDNI